MHGPIRDAVRNKPKYTRVKEKFKYISDIGYETINVPAQRVSPVELAL